MRPVCYNWALDLYNPVLAASGNCREPTGVAGQHPHGPATVESARVERLDAGFSAAGKKVDPELVERKP
jgi:hypothetical protein